MDCPETLALLGRRQVVACVASTRGLFSSFPFTHPNIFLSISNPNSPFNCMNIDLSEIIITMMIHINFKFYYFDIGYIEKEIFR